MEFTRLFFFDYYLKTSYSHSNGMCAVWRVVGFKCKLIFHIAKGKCLSR